MTIMDAEPSAGSDEPSDRPLGADPGEPEAWEITRVRCPECAQPIALVGDEALLPRHVASRAPWQPFASAQCEGSGLPAAEAEPLGEDGGFGPEPTLADFLTLPPELDWRTQPFSHAHRKLHLP
ncbi:hypothetical protein [Streptacidiphilus monticola]|uniref:Uncharacterized protein n=1 Tax=Streptacidiphilus monticola TaxID=2161674 RepID=A0ABW1FZH4_9ACTN